MPETYRIIVFKSTYLTFKAERALKKAGIPHKVVTKPRDVSSDCGLAVRVDAGDESKVLTILAESSVENIGVFDA